MLYNTRFDNDKPDNNFQKNRIFNENKTLFLVILIIILGLLLRLFRLDWHSLWLDEIYQIITIRESWSHLFDAISRHLSPPLDYILLKIFILVFGSSDFAVRLPACLYGTLAIVVLYDLVKRLADRDTALLSALLLAISPMAIAFSQETRMYSLFFLLSLISLNVTFRYLNNISLKNACLLGIVNGLLLLTHYFGFIVVGSEMLGLVIWRLKCKQFKRIYYEAACAGISLSIFAPWLPFLLRQIQHSGGEIWYGLESNLYFFKVIFSRFSSDTGRDDFWFYLFGVLFVLGGWRAWKEKNNKLLVLADGLLITLLGLFVISAFKKIVTPRNLIFMLPVYIMIIAYALRWLSGKTKVTTIITGFIFVLLLAWPIYRYYYLPRPDYKPDWKRSAAYIFNNINPDEKVFVPDRLTRFSLAYYLDSEKDYNVASISNLPQQMVHVIESGEVLALKKTGKKNWVVIPPTIIGKSREERENYNRQLPAPSKKYESQGKPLAIYQLNGEK